MVERPRLDDAAEDRVDADPTRAELDCEVPDEGLQRRLGRADEGVVVEHAVEPRLDSATIVDPGVI